MCEDQGYCAPGVFLQVVADREVALQLRSVDNKEMVGHSPLSREGSREGFHCSRCGCSRGAGSLGKEVVENQVMGSRDKNPGERWYNLGNSSMERWSLFHLEHELDTSLRFE